MGNSKSLHEGTGSGTNRQNSIPLEPMPLVEPNFPKVNIQPFSIIHHNMDKNATITLIQRSLSDGHIERKYVSLFFYINYLQKLFFHVSFTFLVLLFWTFLVLFSGPPTPSCQKE